MATPYENIFKRFLRKIKDYNLANLDVLEAESIINGFLDSAVVKFNYCKQDLHDRDEYTQSFNITLTQLEEEILSKYLVVEWLEPEITTLSKLKTIISDKDFNTPSLANHLNTLLILKKDLKDEIKELISDYRNIGFDIKGNLG